jgi:hypothetical protein
MNNIVSGQEATHHAGDIVSAITRTSKHYATELAMVPWLTAACFAAELEHSARDGRQRVTKEEESITFASQAKSVTLPVRVRDAGHGFAVYAIPAALGQRSVDADGKHFKVADLGHGQTPLALFIMDHRDGDLGTYWEFGLAFLVTPRDMPWVMPAWYIKTSPVNDRFSCEAGRHLWSYNKTLDYHLNFVYEPDGKWVRFTLQQGSYRVLTIAFPRGGSGSSTAIPWYTYTLHHGKPHRILLTRTGRGERIRTGGDGVILVPGSTTENAPNSLGKLVHDLGLTGQSRPFLHGWTEHMSGEFGRPLPLH